jgi:hypothetical protein
VEKEEGVAGKDIHRIGDTMNERIFKMVSGILIKEGLSGQIVHARFGKHRSLCKFWRA